MLLLEKDETTRIKASVCNERKRVNLSFPLQKHTEFIELTFCQRPLAAGPDAVTIGRCLLSASFWQKNMILALVVNFNFSFLI